MTRATLYAIAFARYFILLLGYLFQAPFFLLSILGQIGELYHTAFARYTAETKALLTRYSEINDTARKG